MLTNDSIILSLSARVSPCFILILFLSKHFMAYLTFKQQRLHISSHSMALPFKAFIPFFLHLSCVGLPAAVHFSEAAPADDPVHAEVVHGQLRKNKGNHKDFNKDRTGVTLHPDPKAAAFSCLVQFMSGWCESRHSKSGATR